VQIMKCVMRSCFFILQQSVPEYVVLISSIKNISVLILSFLIFVLLLFTLYVKFHSTLGNVFPVFVNGEVRLTAGKCSK
jgi:hypothetical protein